ncbi:MAG: [FeFe] hydrogenase H-cluster maturation GTPase HydF, partial [bacterium]
LEDVPEADEHSIYVSAITKMHVHELKEMIAHLGQHHEERVLVGDLVKPGDQVILVIPIDESAPKGRIILPQQLVLRDLLDHQAAAICCQVETLKVTLDNMKEPPALVITDSQAFHRVAAIVPEDILLTSFSILMARFKGSLETTIKGLAALDHLEDGDVILIAEGCTHHRQCNDIGTVKIPRWLKAYTHKELKIETSSGLSFPEDLSRYAMIIHCGGCMLNEREVTYRMKCARDSQVPITNYGMAIAHFNGILKRSLRIFPNLLAELDNE